MSDVEIQGLQLGESLPGSPEQESGNMAGDGKKRRRNEGGRVMGEKERC